MDSIYTYLHNVVEQDVCVKRIQLIDFVIVQVNHDSFCSFHDYMSTWLLSFNSACLTSLSHHTWRTIHVYIKYTLLSITW